MLELGLDNDRKITIFIAFPQSDSCGRYGPGVASKKTQENVRFGEIGLEHGTKILLIWVLFQVSKTLQ